jgi:cytochrome c peroxidase
MKYRFLSFIIFALYGILTLENCKREHPAASAPDPDDPDSLYRGTEYCIEVPFLFAPIPAPYTDSLTVEGIYLGRRLFYDKHLSIDGQKACASCHHLQTAFSDSAQKLSTNVFGPTKRNAPVLQNLAWEPALFWDGRQPNLVAQAKDAFHTELGFNATKAVAYLKTDSVYIKLFKKAFGRPGIITERKVYLALQEFEMTLISSNSRFDSLQNGTASFTPSELDGLTIFNTEAGACFHCHSYIGNQLMANYTEGLVYRNNGLQTASNFYNFADSGRGGITAVSTDYGRFKNPSLRNIAVSGPYMHDGRFKTLSEVIHFYSSKLQYSPNMDPFMLAHFDTTAKGQIISPGGFHFTPQDSIDLLILLNDMTDKTFLHNPAFSDPFVAQ